MVWISFYGKKGRHMYIQEKFMVELTLLVEIPTQGSGKTYRGNTASRFFKSSVVSARLTGVNHEWIKRLGIILRCIVSGYSINKESFLKYAVGSAKIFIREYPYAKFSTQDFDRWIWYHRKYPTSDRHDVGKSIGSE